MNKITISAIIISIIAILLGGYGLLKDGNLGQSMIQNSSFFGATSAAFTCPTTATTTNPILSLDNNRTMVKVYNRSGQPMFVHVNAQATTTGVAVNTGVYLSPIGLTTSTANSFVDLSGAKGYVYCISPVAASGTVISAK